MNRTDLQAVRFADDGFPEAADYASNYQVLPHRNKHSMRPRSMRASLRLLRRSLSRLLKLNGRRGNQSAGTRTLATLER